MLQTPHIRSNMKHIRQVNAICLVALLLVSPVVGHCASSLEAAWADPPVGARLRAYWWWLNGNVTKAAITRDLEEMKAKGFGGAVIIDANGATQEGNDPVPHGPTFFTPEWRELYKHALREAGRLGLEMSLNIQSGWNVGGPPVKADDAAKKVVWSEVRLAGPTNFMGALPKPQSRDNYYRDQFVLAFRLPEEAGARASKRRTLHNCQVKARLREPVQFSHPGLTPLSPEL